MDTTAIPGSIVRQAAEWAALLDGDADTREQAACEAWCRKDPRHRLVLSRMRGLDASLSTLDGPQRQLLRQAATDERRRRTIRRAALAVALGAVTAGVLSMSLREPSQFAEQTTARGEQRTVELADRSTLLIDADSALTARIRRTTRQIDLRRGRVLATVAPDRNAPFAVVTPHATATALGTAYMVRVEAHATRVTVVESTVRVCARTAAPCVNLRAGQTVLVPATGGPGMVQSVDATAALAWTRGWLEADDLPMVEALAELAPHLPQALHFDAGALQALRVTGSYPLDRPRAALEAMVATAGLALENTPDGALRISPR